MRLSILIFAVCISQTMAQKRDQYTFAQTYVGAQSTFLKTVSGNFRTPDVLSGRINIGGLHFWQKADFYISFSVADLMLSEPESWQYSEGVTTGGRFLPFGLGRKFPTPFIGISWVTPDLKFGNGANRDEDAIGFEFGFNKIVGRSSALELSVHYRTWSRYNYYTTRLTPETIQAPSFGISLGIKRYLDFTSGMGSEDSRAYQKRQRDFANSNGGLNDWSIAIGPSALINPVDVPYLQQFPWINKRMGASIVPDVGIGKYFSKPDLAIRLAYRPAFYKREAHDLSVQLNQHIVGVEAFKFLFDYHGFVPFVGLTGGISAYSFTARDGNVDLNRVEGMVPSYGLVFGWDIRPTDVEWFILRTNLRYMPGSSETVDSERFLTGQFEFNFIQFVFYPQRRKEYLKAIGS